jgi:hypothetical protein
VTAGICCWDRHDRPCRYGRGSINDRLTRNEAPMAGICERTPVPAGASSHPPARHAAHDHIAALVTNVIQTPKRGVPARQPPSNPSFLICVAVMVARYFPIHLVLPVVGAHDSEQRLDEQLICAVGRHDDRCFSSRWGSTLQQARHPCGMITRTPPAWSHD